MANLNSAPTGFDYWTSFLARTYYISGFITWIWHYLFVEGYVTEIINRQINWIGWKIQQGKRKAFYVMMQHKSSATGNGRRDQINFTLRDVNFSWTWQSIWTTMPPETSAARDQDMTIEKTMELKYESQNWWSKARFSSGVLFKELTVEMNPLKQKAWEQFYRPLTGKISKRPT